ncbi:MAG TPA: zinc-binding dehydrogenase [Geobacterales bacterium]|nr:zinc-binding dehydrogenase [Geobacterales bacterium]
MKVVRLYRHGGVENLKLEEDRIPAPKENEVLVRIRACSMNRLDIWTRVGYPGVNIPLPIILGSDIAGSVEDMGSEVRNFSKGDKVLLYPALVCNRCEYCIAGEHSMCDDLRILGHLVDGGYREYIAVPEDILYKIDSSRSFEEASCLPVTGTTAWRAIFTKASPKPGDVAFVWGAGSGTGIMLIQLLKNLGCKVISTAGSEEKEKRAYSLGCDLVINYKKENVVTRVQEFTNGKGVDVVIDSVGSSTFETSIKICKKGGKLVFFGATSGDLVSYGVRIAYRRQITLLGSYLGSKSEFARMLKLFNEGKLKPVIDSIFKLDEVQKAHQRMEQNLHFGKIVIIP